jgi:hypothetical protein
MDEKPSSAPLAKFHDHLWLLPFFTLHLTVVHIFRLSVNMPTLEHQDNVNVSKIGEDIFAERAD